MCRFLCGFAHIFAGGYVAGNEQALVALLIETLSTRADGVQFIAKLQ